MKLLISFCLLFCQIALFAQEEKIFVQLDTEIPMIPVYVTPIQSQESALTATFQEQARQVLLFDLNHNGHTRTLTANETSALLSLKDQASFDSELPFQKLKNDGLLYLIKLKMLGNELSCKVVSVNAQTGTTIDHIMLSGDLSKDRAKIHQLADAIHKLLFGKSGIATSRILYTVKHKIERPKQEAKYISEVFMADYDGYNARQLTSEGTLITHPMFVPALGGKSSNAFLYVSYKIGQPKMYINQLFNKNGTRVSKIRANQVTPSISPNGLFVAFSSDVAGRADIFLQPLPAQGNEMPTARQIFTAKGTANASPTFSPDGKRMAFVSDKDGSPKVYVMQIPGQGTKAKDIKLQLISKRCRENSAPCWSPDGKKLAYCAKTNDVRQIWIYDFETGKERQLTKGHAIKENPTWASDSLHLLFNAKEGQATEIYLINLNQPKAVKITSGAGEKFFPSWEPKQL